YERLYDTLGLGLTIWSPLAAGLLTGKYNSGIPRDSRLALPGYDWLKVDPLQRGVPAGVGGTASFAALIEAVKKLGPVASDLGASTAQLALAWCAHNPHVTSVITGASRPEQVKENMKAVALLPKLTPEVIGRIEKAIAGATDVYVP
ncbi:MAG TPA: aldo/keto reductase, partial [Candidatus Sulfotelmatobacter sp.]|nr:aldo/keto reductase [Candidatus Sulfotelmatobacter sp.]